MRTLDICVGILLIVGALNWGFVGFFNVNPVAMLFGEASAISRVIYAVIGLGALYEAAGLTFGFKAFQHRWCDYPAAVKH